MITFLLFIIALPTILTILNAVGATVVDASFNAIIKSGEKQKAELAKKQKE